MKKSTAVLITVMTLLLLLFCSGSAAGGLPLSFSQETIAFGENVYGTTVPGKTVTLTNVSEETVVFDDMHLQTDAKESAFEVSAVFSSATTELAPGETYDYVLTPKAGLNAGTYTETFTVTSVSPASAVSFTASITVTKAKPKIGNIGILEATYGMYLMNVSLPAVDNGSFAWSGLTPRSLTVGEIGENTFYYLTFTPADKENYVTVENLAATVKVSKAKPAVKIPSGNAVCGQKLSDVELPAGWAWCIKSPENVKLKPGVSRYLASFLPEDSEHYEILNTEIEVTVSHDFDGKYQQDETGHWKTCVCGEKSAYECHVWTSGTDENGYTYSFCEICGYETEHIPAEKTEDDDNRKNAFSLFIEKITAFFRKVLDLFRNLLPVK